MRALITISILCAVSITSWAKVNCPGKNLISMDRPTMNGKKTFPYTFEYTCKDPSLPTVIYIPGGPGFPSIGTNVKGDMPVNVIATDPRGSGANANYWSAGGKDQDLSTEIVAEDVIAIIENLQLTNYAIHGSSFGTSVATVAASKLEKKKSKLLPNAVILEGVVGKAASDGEQDATSKKMFKELKTEAGFCVTCKLDSLQGSLTPNQIGNLVDAVQSLGKDVALGVLNNYSKDQLVKTALDVDSVADKNTMRVHTAIACREYFVRGKTETPYRAGELESSIGGTCDNNKLENPYDSKKWQVNSKTYYVVGTSDTYTPVAQARYHYENQSNSNKEVICIPRGGHAPLSYNIKNCTAQAYSKMSSGAGVTAAEVGPCNALVETGEFHCK